jgi:hypothetical protein
MKLTTTVWGGAHSYPLLSLLQFLRAFSSVPGQAKVPSDGAAVRRWPRRGAGVVRCSGSGVMPIVWSRAPGSTCQISSILGRRLVVPLLRRPKWMTTNYSPWISANKASCCLLLCYQAMFLLLRLAVSEDEGEGRSSFVVDGF